MPTRAKSSLAGTLALTVGTFHEGYKCYSQNVLDLKPISVQCHGDRDLDIFSCEMEAVRGDRPPRFYIWENVDGYGEVWQEHVILDANLGGHAAVLADITGSGSLDVLTKPWRAHRDNAVKGKTYVLFLEKISDITDRLNP